MTSSSSTDAPSEPETILVGTVLAPHGIRGEVQVAVQSDNRERFAPGAVLRASRGGAAGVTELRVRRSTPHKGGLRISFEGFEDRDAAERLRGMELAVDRSAVPEAAPGSYYLFELVGCRCVDEREGELGTVVEVVPDGGGWVIEVESRADEGGRRLSLPFAEEFLVRVDPAARRIDWKLPEGLVEACASRF
jgi:16S rRNA processing protein RimM